MTAPAGWYPDGTSPGSERYWDGSQWTEQFRAAGPPPPPAPPQAAPAVPGANYVAQSMPAYGNGPKKKNWFAKHKLLSGMGAVILVAAIASTSGGSSDKDKVEAGDDTPVTTATTAPGPKVTKASAPSAPKKPAETSGQRNARRAAENYLDFTPFSRAGLIQQLSSSAGDGYSVADATYAVDSLHANWNEQAYKAAKKYLEFTSFSRSGLIQQLESSAGDKYTHAQAVYGADKALAE